jgi:hypothetical protein
MELANRSAQSKPQMASIAPKCHPKVPWPLHIMNETLWGQMGHSSGVDTFPQWRGVRVGGEKGRAEEGRGQGASGEHLRQGAERKGDRQAARGLPWSQGECHRTPWKKCSDEYKSFYLVTFLFKQ